MAGGCQMRAEFYAQLVIMARLIIRHSPVWYSEFHASPRFNLPNRAAIDLLPRRLACGYWGNPVFPACRPLGRIDHDVALAGVQVDPDTVAGAQPCQAAADRAFRRGVQD